MKIVAIGGGNYALDDADKPYNVEEINEEIVKLANKKHPRFLNIGFNIRSDYYFSHMKKIFMSLGCQCEYLRFSEFSNQKTVESKFKRADVIFLPGGNTLANMRQVRKYGLDKYLFDCASRGVVLAGISAGAIMCFEFGCSDSRQSFESSKRYSKVKGLGIMSGLIAPHYSSSDRVYDLPRMLKTCKKSTLAFGIDECAALIIDGNSFKVVKSRDDAKVFKCYLKGKEYFADEITQYGQLDDLYQI